MKPKRDNNNNKSWYFSNNILIVEMIKIISISNIIFYLSKEIEL